VPFLGEGLADALRTYAFHAGTRYFNLAEDPVYCPQVALGKAVEKACQSLKEDFKFLYPLEAGIKEKIETIAREMYGAAGVSYSAEAEAQIEKYTKQGFSKLPICMAKTQYSFSDNPTLKGSPSGSCPAVRSGICERLGAPLRASKHNLDDSASP
jgi:hypothetical protein